MLDDDSREKLTEWITSTTEGRAAMGSLQTAAMEHSRRLTEQLANGVRDAMRLLRFTDLLETLIHHVDGEQNNELADKLGVSAATVGNWRDRMGEHKGWFSRKPDAEYAVSTLACYAAREGITPKAPSWQWFAPSSRPEDYVAFVMVDESSFLLSEDEAADRDAALDLAGVYLALADEDRAILDAMARRLLQLSGGRPMGRGDLIRHMEMSAVPKDWAVV